MNLLSRPVQLFFCYAPDDEPLRQELEKHLKPMQRAGLITIWHDRLILAGDERRCVLDAHLRGSDIILLLVSANFIASDSCYDIEMKRALERNAQGRSGRARVIPIILTPVQWDMAPFAVLQALPEGGKPVSLWPTRDSAWVSVAEGIRAALGSSPEVAPPAARPPPAALRRFVEAVLLDEMDFSNFCRDHFEEAYQRMGSGMERPRKLLVLLDLVRRDGEEERLLSALQEDFPKASDRHKGLLNPARTA